MAYYRYKRRTYKPKRINTSEKKRKLDMHREEEFRYLLAQLLEHLPESLRGAVNGSIYSIAAQKGAKEAKEYINKKKDEGVIDSSLERQLIDLVFNYSKYR